MTGLYTYCSKLIRVVKLVLLQNLQRTILTIKRSYLFSPATYPDELRVLAGRYSLYRARVFRPKIRDDKPKPLIIMAHGGGYLMNNPSGDDPLARNLADDCDCTVVSIDYSKIPLRPFPAAYEDGMQQVLDLLGDGGKDLNIDHSRIILAGGSAGGNLMAAICQDERLRGRALGLIGVVAVSDLSKTGDELRVNRSEKAKKSGPDFVGVDGINMIRELFNPTGLNMQDPRFSPLYFRSRNDLPKHVFQIGAELDMLCRDTELFTDKLAKAEVGQREVMSDGWKAGNVRWKLVENQPHPFMALPAKTPEAERQRLQVVKEVEHEIFGWLKAVWSSV